MTRLIDEDTWAILTIYGEARGESFAGQLGVAEVIRNRMARRMASDGSVTGTVLRPSQFSCWAASDPNRLTIARADGDDPVILACRAAWQAAQAGSTTVGGAVLYLNPEVTRQLRGGTLPAWAADPADRTRENEARVTARIGAHVFFRA